MDGIFPASPPTSFFPSPLFHPSQLVSWRLTINLLILQNVLLVSTSFISFPFAGTIFFCYIHFWFFIFMLFPTLSCPLWKTGIKSLETYSWVLYHVSFYNVIDQHLPSLWGQSLLKIPKLKMLVIVLHTFPLKLISVVLWSLLDKYPRINKVWTITNLLLITLPLWRGDCSSMRFCCGKVYKYIQVKFLSDVRLF